MRQNDIAIIVVDSALTVHRAAGPGLLQSVYQAALAYELRDRGFRVEVEVPVPVVYREVKLEVGFRADLIVEGCVLTELESIEQIHPVHKKQTLTYLKLTGCKLGLLTNFGDELLKDAIHRVVNGL